MADEEVLEFANKEKQILLTLNRKHFIRLHNKHRPHGGIIACTFDSDFSSLAVRIDNALREKIDFTRKLVRINRPQ